MEIDAIDPAMRRYQKNGFLTGRFFDWLRAKEGFNKSKHMFKLLEING